MAGVFWGSLGSGFAQGQDQLLQRQILEQQLRERQSVPQGSDALQRALLQLRQPPPQSQQQPQTPMPGQASQPQQPPQQPMGGPQGPGNGPAGMQPPPGGQMPQMGGQPMFSQLGRPPPQAPQSPQLGAPGGRPPIQPYTAPQSPQQQMPPGGGGLPPPPNDKASHAVQQALPNLFDLAEQLQKNGVTGMPLYEALKQYQGLMSIEGRQQFQQLQMQLREVQAEASLRRAGTGETAEARKGQTAAGANPMGASVIAKNLGAADASEARAKKTAAGGSVGAGGPGGIKPETIDYYARQSLAGDNSWQVGLARGKVGQALISAVKDRIPQLAKESGMSPEQASGVKDQRAALSKTLTDRQKYVATGNQFVANFKKQADLVEKYMKSGVAGSLPVINKWLQAGRKATGDPDVAAFDTAVRGLAREHQRIVTGVTSNAQLHASAQETADALLNKDMSAEQMKASLKVMREEAQNAISSGKDEVDFLKTQIQHLGAQAPDTGAKAKVYDPATGTFK